MVDTTQQTAPAQPQEPAVVTPAETPTTQPVAEVKPSTSLTPYIIGAVAGIAVIAMLVFIILPRSKSVGKNTLTQNKLPAAGITNNPTVTAQSPTIAPVTVSNADQTLTNTTTNIQQSIDQVNKDINSVSSIDTTQDNPNNL